jgi:hypothetical protein
MSHKGIIQLSRKKLRDEWLSIHRGKKILNLIEHDIGLDIENQQSNRKKIEVIHTIKKVVNVVMTLHKPDEERTEREMHDLIKIIDEFTFPSVQKDMKENRLYRADIVELCKKARHMFV